jgi:formiminotetrahydrofolate cyclodeaminase
LLEAFSRPTPTPGGGSASALAGAIGAALLVMVAGLPKIRGGGDRHALAAAAAELRQIVARLRTLIDLDSQAYEAVVAAYALPKGTDEERRTRAHAVQRALEHATETPLDVMDACARALDQAGIVADHGNPNAASDVAVGIELVGAALRGARLNVEINLDSLTDAAYAESARNRARDLARRGAERIAARTSTPPGRV